MYIYIYIYIYIEREREYRQREKEREKKSLCYRIAVLTNIRNLHCVNMWSGIMYVRRHVGRRYHQ